MRKQDWRVSVATENEGSAKKGMVLYRNKTDTA